MVLDGHDASSRMKRRGIYMIDQKKSIERKTNRSVFDDSFPKGNQLILANSLPEW
jgi:lambda repressor-like predicted transcriptional regulator